MRLFGFYLLLIVLPVFAVPDKEVCLGLRATLYHSVDDVTLLTGQRNKENSLRRSPSMDIPVTKERRKKDKKPHLTQNNSGPNSCSSNNYCFFDFPGSSSPVYDIREIRFNVSGSRQ